MNTSTDRNIIDKVLMTTIQNQKPNTEKVVTWTPNLTDSANDLLLSNDLINKVNENEKSDTEVPYTILNENAIIWPMGKIPFYKSLMSRLRNKNFSAKKLFILIFLSLILGFSVTNFNKLNSVLNKGIRCQSPLNKSTTAFSCLRNMILGSSCEVVCPNGYYLGTGYSTATCKTTSYITGYWRDEKYQLWNPECFKIKSCKNGNKFGKVKIFPQPFTRDGIEVLCQGSNFTEGRWMVIQRRFDGSVNFTRTYDEYVHGFGDINGEFWMGLENIHQLTSNANYSLLIELGDLHGNTTFAKYSTFRIGNASSHYTLHVGKFVDGKARDGLRPQNGMEFSAVDLDNDKWEKVHCSLTYRGGGGWWFNERCGNNLNGRYYKNGESTVQGIKWWYWKRNHESLTYTAMKLRLI